MAGWTRGGGNKQKMIDRRVILGGKPAHLGRE